MKLTDKFKTEGEFHDFVRSITKKYKGADYIGKGKERAELIAKEIDALGLSPEEHKEFLYNFCVRTLEIPLAADLYAHYGYAISGLELSKAFNAAHLEYNLWIEANDMDSSPLYSTPNMI